MSSSDRAIERCDRQDGLSPHIGAPTITQPTQPGCRTILTFTGHRPQRMGGFNPDNPTARWGAHSLLMPSDERSMPGSAPLLPAGRWDSTIGPPAPSLISSSS
ncbi:MAG: hypothetical protein M3R61_17655 [Chloroflexota bacterium]|nr:hypothetical protein [Chloroflexota bacterium]